MKSEKICLENLVRTRFSSFFASIFPESMYETQPYECWRGFNRIYEIDSFLDKFCSTWNENNCEYLPPSQSVSVHSPSQLADRLLPFHIQPGRIVGPHPLPSRQFKELFDSLFKIVFIFPSWYLFAIGLSLAFSHGWNLPPDWATFPNNPSCRQCLMVRQGPGTKGLSPSPVPSSKGLGPGPPLRTLLQTTIWRRLWGRPILKLGYSQFARCY